LEIDQFNDYEYAIQYAPSEQKDFKMVLVYLIKKSVLRLIEGVFKKNKISLKSIISRYQGFQWLFNSNVLTIPEKQTTLMVDVSQTRVRLYIAINGKINMFRRMLIRLDLSGKSESEQLKDLMSTIIPFIESAIDTYLIKFTNQAINEINIVSDSVFLSPSNIKSFKVKGRPFCLLPINPDYFKFDNVTRKVTFLFAYASFYLNNIESNSFNLIPNLKRFEKRVKQGLVVACLLFISVYSILTVSNYLDLKKEYSSFIKNRSGQASKNLQKRREMVSLRNRINKQKKVIDISDLTTAALKSELRIDYFLFRLVGITSQDIQFKSLRIRKNRANIVGSSSSDNGNYSFYAFIQKIEEFPNFDRVKYNLGLDKSTERSTFSLEVYFKDL